MKSLVLLLHRIHAKIGFMVVIYVELLKSLLSPTRKLKILFSKHQGWEENIRNGFRFTRHELSFEEFSAENIKNHDLVVPLFIRDLIYLNGIRNLIEDNPIPIPNTKSIVLCDDKYLFNLAMKKNGFGELIPKMGGALAYPYFLKKRIDDSSNHSHIISNSEQEELFKDAIASTDYFCQEMIPGPREYATHILFKNSEILHSINIEYVFDKEISIKGKDKANYTRICRCPYLGFFSSILESIEFEGLCCVNYKVVDNQPFILEINPRFGGSLCPFFFSFMRNIC